MNSSKQCSCHRSFEMTPLKPRSSSISLMSKCNLVQWRVTLILSRNSLRSLLAKSNRFSRGLWHSRSLNRNRDTNLNRISNHKLCRITSWQIKPPLSNDYRSNSLRTRSSGNSSTSSSRPNNSKSRPTNNSSSSCPPPTHQLHLTSTSTYNFSPMPKTTHQNPPNNWPQASPSSTTTERYYQPKRKTMIWLN